MLSLSRTQKSILALTLALVLPEQAALAATDVVILKTQSLPAMDQLVNGFKEACRVDGSVREFNLEGQSRRAEAVFKEINSINDSNINLVLTIGEPAAVLADKSLDIDASFYALSSSIEKMPLKRQTAKVISSIPPFDEQISSLKKIISPFKSVGVVFDETKTGGMAESLERSAQSSGLIFVKIPVSSEQAAIDAIEKISKQVDLLVLLPDSTVLSSKRIAEVVSILRKKQAKSLVYSEELLNKGFLIGIVRDYEKTGKRLGGSCSTTGNPTVEEYDPNDFQITINVNAAEDFGLAISDAP